MTSGQRGAEAPERKRPTVPAAGQRRTLRLDGLPRQVALGRDFARTALADWAWPGDEAVEDLLLVVSELLANACLHAHGATQLTLHITADRLRIEVLDGTLAFPGSCSPHDPGRPGGHGLHIVGQLADDWGFALHDSGKTVWADVRIPRPHGTGW